MTRVLVLRAREDAERTASILRAMGFTPLLSPVLEIVGTGASIPRGPFDAVLATSAKGLEFCVAPGELQSLPLHAVGARTTRIAQELGWRPDLFAGDARGLLPLIRGRHETPARFLYLAGRDRRDELETGLRAAGHEVAVAVTYEARAAPTLAPAALDALEIGEIDAALHYSRRGAEIFMELARAAGLAERLSEIDHLALSSDAAWPLPRARIAERPDEEHLLRLLRSR